MLEHLINTYWTKLFSNCQEWSHLFSENGQVLDSGIDKMKISNAAVKFSVGLEQLQSYCAEFGTLMDAKFTVTTPMYANKVRLADNRAKYFVSHGMTFGGKENHFLIDQD